MRVGAYRLENHLAKEIFPKVKNSVYRRLVILVNTSTFFLINRRPKLVACHLNLESHVAWLISYNFDSKKRVRFGGQRRELVINHLLPMNLMRGWTRRIASRHTVRNGSDNLQIRGR